MTRPAGEDTRPTSTTRPDAMATSATNAGAPVPSTTVPPLMTVSTTTGSLCTGPGGVAAWCAVRFDPYGDECHRDPYPTYRALRDQAPVYHDEERGFWALSRFDDVIGALHAPTTFLSGDGIALEGQAR